MTGALGWATCLAASAASAGLVLAAGGSLGEGPAPAPPATVCVGFWQGEWATGASGAGVRTADLEQAEEVRAGQYRDDQPCGTPPDDWRPELRTDSAASLETGT
jgi:hypothetical protein